MRQRILAIDPGKATGLAFHDWDSGVTDFREAQFDDTCEYVEQAAKKFGNDLLLIAESFIITPHTAKNTQAPWSLELIGVCRRISRKYTGQDLFLQAPSSAKRFSGTDRLKAMGYWSTGLKGHANDAARHLLLAEATRGYLSQDVLLTLTDLV